MDSLEMDDFFLEDEEGVSEVEDLLPPLGGSIEDEKVIAESTEESSSKKDNLKSSGVERYSSTGMEYPCFILSSSVSFPKHVITALSRMIESSLDLDNLIKVYIESNSEMLSLGGISPIQVKAAIDLLGRENIEAYFSKEYLLSDDLIYVLSS